MRHTSSRQLRGVVACLGMVACAMASAGAPPDLAFVSLRAGDAHIFVSNGAGSDRPLTSGQSVNTQPAWSPDGRFIAFTSNRAGPMRVFVMSRDGKDVRALTTDARMESSPSWSPDGRSIALYSRAVATGEIDVRVVDATSGAVQAVIAANGFDKGPDTPVWSANGRRLAFTGNTAEGRAEIWVANRDGSDLRTVSEQASKRSKGQPALSPDGRQVAFVADLRGSVGLFVTDLDSGATRNLTDGLQASHESPRWSHDGKQIVFGSTRDDPGLTRMDIFVMNADGTGVRNLSRHPHEDFNPHWSADGQRVVFNSLRSGTAQLFAVDLQTGQTQRLTDNPSHDTEPALRPSSQLQ